MADDRNVTIKPYRGPSGGYGSLKSVARHIVEDKMPLRAVAELARQNKPGGFMCTSCAWGKPATPHPFEFCENGAKATAWDTTRERADAGFFETHTLAELETWTDHDLEKAGRLTEPMRWNPATDRYEVIGWEQALADIGERLKALSDTPDRTVFYVSGRASLEASFLWQLFARLYGTNNLPDSSNMCHESTSVALPESIGVSVGTVTLQDFEQTDLILHFAHNPGTSTPRLLHELQNVAKRGVPLIAFNPLKERALERFTNPQSPKEMLTLSETRISSAIHQVRAGGDIAALTGICKALIAMDDAALAEGEAGPTDRDELLAKTENDAGFSIKAAAAASKSRKILDHDFIAEHTTGFEAFAEHCRSTDWSAIERISGLTRSVLEDVARLYAQSDKVMALYGMGLTQHVAGVENVQMLVNLLLLRGNIGKAGAGLCAIRGHSNVQGQRTVGITEKPELAPLDVLSKRYGFEPPRQEGLTTVHACEKMISGELAAFVALGGNLLRAAPDLPRIEAAWRNLDLTVGIATKLNRSHVVHGKAAYLLPCLVRSETDQQAAGPQTVTMESSLAQFHGSIGKLKPAGSNIRSEPAIVAGLARAVLPPNPNTPWEAWVGDYRKIRAEIETVWPATFGGLEQDMLKPGGLSRPVAARERKWNTRSGKANFITPQHLFAGDPKSLDDAEILQLITLRSNDQFNTTVYGYRDRFRGVTGTRMVVFMNAEDAARRQLKDGMTVDLATASSDDIDRSVRGFRVVIYDIPRGCIGAYFPEANPLVPLYHHDRKATTPAYKAVPVRVTPAAPPSGPRSPTG